VVFAQISWRELISLWHFASWPLPWTVSWLYTSHDLQSSNGLGPNRMTATTCFRVMILQFYCSIVQIHGVYRVILLVYAFLK
jgi:hypothetical protein